MELLFKGMVQTAAAAALHRRLTSAFPQETLEVRGVHVDHALWTLDGGLIESCARGTFQNRLFILTACAS